MYTKKIKETDIIDVCGKKYVGIKVNEGQLEVLKLELMNEYLDRPPFMIISGVQIRNNIGTKDRPDIYNKFNILIQSSEENLKLAINTINRILNKL
ncbi:MULTISPECIES: hypothetical protein [unclassified Clostridioides]|uniref:hypothetical protein n=1 Tax=unclassified Clostridioides TaxID=2635829 RepID=UPI001D1220D2|nr:hypothetical protein JJC01_12220 [Clostridioides sp. ES-S-0010-02]UDN63471.1 hypothetical protein IC758_08440 [Clostridioides sp. ES-W-0016-02]